MFNDGRRHHCSFSFIKLMDISTESGIGRIKFFRHAIYSRSEVGKLLLINFQTSQPEAGIALPLLEQPNIQIPYLTPAWTTSLRDFHALHNISVTLTDQGQSPSKSASDSYIINLQALLRYTMQQQRDINLVRQHLQVVTFSEMCDPSDLRKNLNIRCKDAVQWSSKRNYTTRGNQW